MKHAQRTSSPYKEGNTLSLSESKGNGKLCSSFHALLASCESADTPITMVFAIRKCSYSSAKPLPSQVQPGVPAFGYHQIKTCIPFWTKSSNDIMFPFSSGRVKRGASWPIAKNPRRRTVTRLSAPPAPATTPRLSGSGAKLPRLEPVLGSPIGLVRRPHCEVTGPGIALVKQALHARAANNKDAPPMTTRRR
eukprot:TRINITY_DN5337_c0_g3_i1.p1 TRINITY_DN5337_c0_g3~~TRINITY_DN5337_c0_g3_i1.p1  ORF type:complete len:193 (-),score=15.06 TRINITY_DN5337_c0_g3_i1:74-652(-)